MLGSRGAVLHRGVRQNATRAAVAKTPSQGKIEAMFTPFPEVPTANQGTIPLKFNLGSR